MPFRLGIGKISISGIKSNTRGNLFHLGFIQILTGGRFSNLLIHLLILFSEILGLLILNLYRSIKQFIFHAQIKRIKFILRILIDNLRGRKTISKSKTIIIKFLTALGFALIFRITTGLIGFSLIKISNGISNLRIITKTSHFNRRQRRMIRRRINITTGRRRRRIRSTSRASNTSTTGRVTINSIRRNTSKTPTGRSITRIIILILTIPSLLLIIKLFLHILQVIFLLKIHLLLLILPIAFGLNTAKERTSKTGSGITNSTSSSGTNEGTKVTKTRRESFFHIVQFFYRKVGEGRASALRNIYQVYCGPLHFSLFN